MPAAQAKICYFFLCPRKMSLDVLLQRPYECISDSNNCNTVFFAKLTLSVVR